VASTAAEELASFIRWAKFNSRSNSLEFWGIKLGEFDQVRQGESGRFITPEKRQRRIVVCNQWVVITWQRLSTTSTITKSALFQDQEMNTTRAKNTSVIEVQGAEIQILERGSEDYISLTDMASSFDSEGEGGHSYIDNWLRSKNTIEFLGVWEKLNNPSFNSVEFDGIRIEAGTNRFRMSAKKWGQITSGIGLLAKTGRYGSGTFAHKDIAFEFASWLSPEFKLYIIKEFQRLRESFLMMIC